MYELNLLPWREALSSYQEKALKRYLFCGLLMSISSMTGVYIYQWQVKVSLEEALLPMQQELSRQQEVVKTMTADGGRAGVSRLELPARQMLIAIVQPQDQSVCFTGLSGGERQLNIKGEAQSIIAIKKFINTMPGQGERFVSHIKKITKKKNEMLNFNILLSDKS